MLKKIVNFGKKVLTMANRLRIKQKLKKNVFLMGLNSKS